MKELLQAVDVEKYISLFKKGIASLIICSMFMSDAAKAMDEEERDPSHLPIFQRTPSSNPQSNSSEQNSSSSDGDSSPRSESLSSTLRTTGLEIIDSRPNSDDSGSSPEKSLLEGDKSLPVIPFPALSLSHSQNIPSASISFTPAPSSFPSQQVDLQSNLGITPSSLQDRVPSPQVFSAPLEARLSSRDVPQADLRPSEKDLLLVSGTNSYGSSHSSHSSESSSDSEEDVEVGGTGHPQHESLKPFSGLRDAFGQFIKKFTSTQPLTTDQSMMPSSNRWQSTPSVITLKNNEILENGGNGFILRQGHLSIQSQDGGEGELTVDVDLDGDDENQALQSSCCSGRPFWPQLPEYTLTPGALQRASQFLTLLPKQAPESHYSGSDEGERSNSFDSESPQSDSPTRGSPTAILRHGRILPDSSEDDLGIEAHLLPADHPHRTMDYASFKGMLRPSGAFISPHSDQVLAPSQPQLLSSQSTWLHLLNDLKKLPASAKSQLKDFVHQVLNGKSTWPQRLGKWVIGPIIGAAFAWAMGPVYDGGIVYLKSLSPFFNKFEDSIFAAILTLYISFSALPDGVSRNAHLWKKAISYLSQEKKEKGRMVLSGVVGALVALLPLTYLITSEEYAIDDLGLDGFHNAFGRTIVIFGPFMYIDGLFTYFNTAWTSFPEAKEWLSTLFCPASLKSKLRSSEENQKEKFDGYLRKLKGFLAIAPAKVIEEIYSDVKDVIAGARSEEDLGAQQAFAAISYLLSLGEEVEETFRKPVKQSTIFDISFDILKYSCLILGAPTVGLLLQFVGTTVVGFLCSNVVAQSIAGVIALATFLPFNYLLQQNMNNFKKVILEGDLGYESHLRYRFFTKAYIALQSLVYLFPPLVAVLASYQQWFGDGWWPVAAGIPVFIPKFMGLFCNFNDSFNKRVATSIINGCHKVGGKCKEDSLCTPCQKDWLIRLVDSSRNNLENLNPKLIHNFQEAIKIFKSDNANNLFDEV